MPPAFDAARQRAASALAAWRLPLLVAALMLAVFTATRVVLLALSGIGAAPFATWPGVFAKGLLFDLAVVAVALGPVLLYQALLPARVRTTRTHAWLRMAWLAWTVALLLFGAIAEFTFWQEFSTRLNFIAVDYLLYTHEVVGNIRESYPLPAIFAGLAMATVAACLLLRRPLRAADIIALSRRQRALHLALGVALPALAIGLVDVDRMHGSGNAYADELSGNGFATLAAAMRRNELDYDRFYLTMPQARADALLARLRVERKPLQAGVMRDAEMDAPEDRLPFRRRPRNIVLVSVESLSAAYLGAYGNRDGLTPNLDRIASEGLRFARFYATGTRTVRGLEALSLGTPPVPGQAIVRRPHNAHLASVGEVLEDQGYAVNFIYGGYGYFDNMNAYFAGNDYRVVDRTDFPASSVMFGNVWGVADEALFDNALRQIDRSVATGKPVFTQIMTTSNHRPYTYPDGRIDIPSPGGRAGAVKYTDYAIGKFLRDARGKPWFDDTLFVIVADHCASVAGQTRLPVEDYRIPLIFYAPRLLPAGVDTDLASQIDLPPTLLEILGARGDNLFFGLSLFESGTRPQRAFVSNYQDLGYYKDDRLTVLEPRRRAEAFRIDPGTGAATPEPVDAQLLAEAIAYYQTASRAFKDGVLAAPDHLAAAAGAMH